ncbi:MAG: hypothetical protein HND52_11635 [Ignavibacteriae bacterium]|nr:hypothetical protein [Ignavibacteriota bacterium]NOG98601.1 hypothetical protein [Ignavibacteriota bacterium]
MKKIIALIFLISTINLAQSWNSIKTSNISVSLTDNVEMFTNSFGNNIIKESSGVLTYYAMNVSGTAGAGITIESSGVTNANITGDEHRVYVVYEKDNVIKAKYSTNSGSNWTTISNLSVNPTSLDAVYYNGLLHLTYSASNLASYYQFTGSSSAKYKDVSSTEAGTNPRIEILEDENKVYVAYDNGDNCKSREYNVVTNSWGSIQTLFTSLSDANLAGFGVDANYIYLYYYRWEVDPIFGGGFSLFENKIQKSNYSTVSSLRYFRTEVFFTNSTTTYDEKVITALQWIDALGKYEAPDAGLNIATFDDGTRSFQTVYATYDPLNHVDISSTHNDLHVIWKIPSSSYLRYRQYDTTPSTPQKT